MPERKLQADVVTCNALIYACEQGRQWARAVHFLRWMLQNSLRPDEASYVGVMSALSAPRLWKLALESLEDVKTHAILLTIATFASCMVVLRRACRWSEALVLLASLQVEGLQPNPVVLDCVGSSCELGWEEFLASRSPCHEDGFARLVRQILDASSPEKAAELSVAELPIRYAQRILQIEGFAGWKTSPELVEVHRLYSSNFRDLRLVEMEVINLEPFTETIARIKGRMAVVIPKLATAMRNLEHNAGGVEDGICRWLDTFFLSRIGTEMLTSQYMALANPDPNAKRRRRVGVVDYACDPVSICEQAAKHAKKLCKEHFSSDLE
ncbi:unnamed protein product, partial [Polarella glacialis]